MANIPATSQSSGDTVAVSVIDRLARQIDEVKLLVVGYLMPTDQVTRLRHDSEDAHSANSRSPTCLMPHSIDWLAAHSLAGEDFIINQIFNGHQVPLNLRKIARDMLHERCAIVFHVSLAYYSVDKIYNGDWSGTHHRPLLTLREQWQNINPEKLKRAVVVLYNYKQPDLRGVGEFVRDLSSISFFRNTRLLDTAAEIDERSLAQDRWVSIEFPYECVATPDSNGRVSSWNLCDWPAGVTAQRFAAKFFAARGIRGFSIKWPPYPASKCVPIFELAKSLDSQVSGADAKAAVYKSAVQQYQRFVGVQRTESDRDILDVIHKGLFRRTAEIDTTLSLRRTCCLNYQAQRAERYQREVYIESNGSAFLSRLWLLGDGDTLATASDLPTSCPECGESGQRQI